MNEEQKDKMLDKLEKQFYLNNPKKGMLDAVREKMVSRKLLVFITATILVSSMQIDPETWGMIAMMYIGGQSAIDFAKIWRNVG